MDRAEAIKVLEEIDLNARMCGFLPAHKAVDMAITALREQEQREQGCEWCYVFQKDPHFYVSEGNGQYTDVVFECCPMCGHRLEE